VACTCLFIYLAIKNFNTWNERGWVLHSGSHFKFPIRFIVRSRSKLTPLSPSSPFLCCLIYLRLYFSFHQSVPTLRCKFSFMDHKVIICQKLNMILWTPLPLTSYSKPVKVWTGTVCPTPPIPTHFTECGEKFIIHSTRPTVFVQVPRFTPWMRVGGRAEWRFTSRRR